MKTKMKSVLLTVIGFVFALCLAVVCGLGFKPAYTVSANTASTLKMEDGAQVRLVANDPGLRFTASISTEEYESVKAAGGTFGMFILPNVYNTANAIGEDTAFGANAVYCWGGAEAGKTQIIHCSTDNLTQTSTDGNTTYFACAITNIKVENYEVDFFARAYYEVNGVRVWADANETNVRSVSYVAQKVLGYEKAGTYAPSAMGKTALLEYVTQFVEAEVDGEGAATGDAYLYVADLANVASITIGGEEASWVDMGGEVMLSGLTKGRQTATVTLADGSTWDLPFVYADYVIRNFADVAALPQYYIDNDTDERSNVVTLSHKYIVVANDVVCEATNIKHTTVATWFAGGTFDGYGHALKGLYVGQGSKGLVGSLEGATIKDLALVDLVVNNTSTATSGLCGTVNKESKVENVFISGYVATKSKDKVYLLGQEIQGAIENCVVVDNSYAHNQGLTKNAVRAVLGMMKAEYTDAKVANVVLRTFNTNYALCTGDTANNKDTSLNDDRVENLTRVHSTAAAMADMRTALETFVTLNNNFTYDATSATLYLNGNAIYVAQ